MHPVLRSREEAPAGRELHRDAVLRLGPRAGVCSRGLDRAAYLDKLRLEGEGVSFFLPSCLLNLSKFYKLMIFSEILRNFI